MSDAIDELGLLEDEEIELDLAALHLSALDHEGVDFDHYESVLDDFTGRLAEVGADAETIEQQAAALAQVFAQEFGFIGDGDNYGAPVNADMIRVLDRRQGLPVILAILYVAAARRVGWHAYALNTPGHVLVRLGHERFMLIDPFDGGKAVSKDGLRSLMSGFMGRKFSQLRTYLNPVPNRTILVRLLRNQASRAEEAGDIDRAIAVQQRMTRIAPEFGDVWWDLARLQLRVQDFEAARLSLTSMLEITRDPNSRRKIVEALEGLAAKGG